MGLDSQAEEGAEGMKSFMIRRGQPSRRQGFFLLATAVSIAALLGVLGLAMDLGSAYIARNEAQAFTDSAALAAALRLNGTLAGISAAKAAVTGSANKWYFASRSFSGVTTEFSTDKVAWAANPTTGVGYRYVRVTAPSNSLATTFTRVITNQPHINIAARSVAGIVVGTTYPQGVFPFAPFAHNPNPPNFGYSKGDELTLLWPSSVQSNGQSQHMNNLCQSDRNAQALQAVRDGTTAERGYIQENSASAIAAAIEDDHMNYTVTLGMAVERTGGVKTTVVYQSLDDRVNQDSMPNQADYDTYIANHDASPLRRLVIVPIISNATDAVVLGFAYVFLPPNQPHNPNKSKCAMYIGPADLPVGNIATGANLVRLIE
jgi:Flp pilus assembly protein TadG